MRTTPLHTLTELTEEEALELAPGTEVGCVFTPAGHAPQCWMHLGHVVGNDTRQGLLFVQRADGWGIDSLLYGGGCDSVVIWLLPTDADPGDDTYCQCESCYCEHHNDTPGSTDGRTHRCTHVADGRWQMSYVGTVCEACAMSARATGGAAYITDTAVQS